MIHLTFFVKKVIIVQFKQFWWNMQNWLAEYAKMIGEKTLS